MVVYPEHDQVDPASTLVVDEVNSDSTLLSGLLILRPWGLHLVPPVGGDKDAIARRRCELVNARRSNALFDIHGRAHGCHWFTTAEILTSLDNSSLVAGQQVERDFTRDSADKLIDGLSVRDAIGVTLEHIHHH